MATVEFNSVSKVYQTGDEETHALVDLSFQIEEGSFTTILGPSGSGKSTTLNILGGMDKNTTGEVIVGNKNIALYDDEQLTEFRRSEIGFVFQFYNLIPNLNVYENVDISSRLAKQPFDAKEMLTSVGLGHRMKHFPAELSGGELQRVSIARALCKNPNILLCVEPTGALDSETGKKILVLLQEMAQKYKKTVVVVTHNSLIAPAADRVIKLKDGKLVEILDNKTPVKIEEVDW